MTKLLPCPFCGNDDRYAIRAVLETDFTVMCRDCRAEGPVAKTEEEARKLWNQRERPDPHPDWVEFSDPDENGVRREIARGKNEPTEKLEECTLCFGTDKSCQACEHRLAALSTVTKQAEVSDE